MYACAKCHQQFIHLSSLTKHVRGHEEEKLSLVRRKTSLLYIVCHKIVNKKMVLLIIRDEPGL